MKYIWTGHMCAVAASGVCGPDLWSLLLKALRCHSRVLVRPGSATSSWLIHVTVSDVDPLKTLYTAKYLLNVSVNRKCNLTYFLLFITMFTVSCHLWFPFSL